MEQYGAEVVLFTLNPQTPIEVLMSWMVNGITILVAKMVS